MLEHLGQPTAARHIVSAIKCVLTAGRMLTRDLGGSAGTADLGIVIAEEVGRAS